MADTYEKDLAQKSSLTTSDFIRVVGSDNVSYKQSISDVMDVMGVDGLMMPSNIIPSGSTVETYANGLSKGFHLACNNSSSTATAQGAPFTCPCTYYITVYTVNEYIQIICQPWNPNVANSKTLAVKTKYGGTWSGWTIMPTRAEVDALNSNSSADIAISISSGTASSKTVIKRGNSINIHILISGMSAPATGTVGTLPSGYIPSGTRYLSGYIVINNARIPMCFSVSPSGNITYGYSSVQTATQIEIFGDVIL